MDIKNIFDFESKIDFLLNTYNDDIEGALKSQNQYLNSNIVNENFNNIEQHLNAMYEKVRILDEVISYAKIYVQNEIDSTITECKNILNDIENLNDLAFNDEKNYTITNVSLAVNESLKMTDRDGTTLKTCELYNGMVSLSGTVKNSIEVSEYSIKRSEQVYEDNIDNLKNGDPYRAFYLLEEISTNGVEEVISFKFKEPKEINSINLKLSNCKLKNIIYIHEDGTEIIDEDILRGVIPTVTVSGIKLTIVNTNYEVRSVSVKTTESNKYESLNAAWKNEYDNIKSQDLSHSKIEYKDKLCKYLENIYLQEAR